MNSNFNDNLKPTRSGFTLVELLFVIAIIGVLAAMTAGILGKAKKDAQISATRSRITQIEAIMQTVMEDQEVRRLPGDLNQFVSSFAARQQRSRARNLNRRISAALLQAEFPVALYDGTDFSYDNLSIGLLAPNSNSPADSKAETSFNSFHDWADMTYGSALVTFLDTTQTAEMAFWQNVAQNTDLDLPGEYLYLILSRVNIDGISGVEALGSNANVIANDDEDDFPEIVDAFGDSMELRLVQVACTGAGEVWTDVAPADINWKQTTLLANGTPIPKGYHLLNPVIPRSLNKIRFQVVSRTLEEIE